MATNILMPALSPTMEEGKLAKWLVKEGDTVKSGTILAEIETDKATMEFEAVDEGKIGKILVPEGSEGVKVNAPIAVLLDEGEKLGDLPAAAPAARQARHSRCHEGHQGGGVAESRGNNLKRRRCRRRQRRRWRAHFRLAAGPAHRRPEGH